MDKILGIGDVMVLLNVSSPLVYRFLSTGQLEGRKVAGKWRTTELAVEKFVRGGSGDGGAASKPAEPQQSA